MFDDSLTKHIGPPNCVHHGVVQFYFEDLVQPFLYMCLYDVWSLILA